MMRKIILLLGLSVALVACRRDFEYNIPVNPIDCYFYDNFCYPETLTEFINYLKFYEKDLNIPLYRDYCRNRKYLSMVSNDSVFMIMYKNDTLDYRPKMSPCNLDGLPDERWNMKHYFTVSMQTDDSYGFSITTEDLKYRFNRDLYNLVAEKIPAFRKNRRERVEFKIVVLKYSDGTLCKVCESDPFDLANYPLYNDLLTYVRTFAMNEALNKITFYYMYD